MKCDRCEERNPETTFRGAFGYSVLCNECYADLTVGVKSWT